MKEGGLVTEDNKFVHSVYLDQEKCRGCVNCIKRCPTEAIRVWNGKAHILEKFCIDCGECVRICPHHAKRIRREGLELLDRFEYTIALPPPSLYVQFNHLDNVNIVLTALLRLGFDDVYEVADAAEQVSGATRSFLASHSDSLPYISTACPTVVRLIRIRFPGLIPHLLPLNPPVEAAVCLARRRAMERTGLRADQIGVIFLSPCPAKMTYIKSPLGTQKSEIDGALAIKDIYPSLLVHMKATAADPLPLSTAGSVGVNWGRGSGESYALDTNRFLSADGIENVISVLEDLEDEKLQDLRFVELDACPGGCVGGVLQVENPYVARSKFKLLNHYLPQQRDASAPSIAPESLKWDSGIQYEPVFRLGNNVMQSISMVQEVNRLLEQLPGLDCGCCGAPTCRARAEDIVRGQSSTLDCIHVLKRTVQELSASCTRLADEALQKESSCNDSNLHTLLENLQKLGAQAALLDTPLSSQRQDSQDPSEQKEETQNDHSESD